MKKEKNKAKLLSAAIMLSGLLSTSPVIAEDFPIIINNNEDGKITGGGYSNQQLETSIYKVINENEPQTYTDYLKLELTADEKDTTKNIFDGNKNTKGNGGVISLEGYSVLSVNGDLSEIFVEKERSKEYYHFTNNSSVGNGGAIYMNTKAAEEDYPVNSILHANFENNSALGNGGAIYFNLESGVNPVFYDTKFTDNTSQKNGGAIYYKSNSPESFLDITASELKNNSAAEKGGAIYFDGMKGGYEAEEDCGSALTIYDTDVIGNSAKQGSAIYSKNAEIEIFADKKDVTFDNKNDKNLYGIYLEECATYGLDLGANADRTLTINDNIYVQSSNTLSMKEIEDFIVNNSDPYSSSWENGFRELLNEYSLVEDIFHTITLSGDEGGSNRGTIELNGKIDIKTTSGLTGFYIPDWDTNGTLKLGKTPATGSYSFIVGDVGEFGSGEKVDFTIDLQNEHAGDTLTIPYLISSKQNNLLNFKVDFNATTKEIDNIVVENAGGDFLKDKTPSVKFDLSNVYIIDDNQNFKDGTIIRYLTDKTATGITDKTETTSTIVLSDGTQYNFAKTDKVGELSVTRSICTKTIEECIADETIVSYTLKDNIKLEDTSKGLGTLYKDKDFTIRGNEYSLDGNGKDGITVGNAEQILNIDGVKGFKNFKTAVTNKGVVNINNSTFEDNDIDLINEKTANVENSTLNGVVKNQNGILNLINSQIKNTVENDAELIVRGENSSLKNVTGTGSTEIGSSLTFDSENGIQQKKVTINENGSLEVYADKVVVTEEQITNNGNLILKSQEGQETANNNKISGFGTTTIAGNIKTEKEIASANIVINEECVLNSVADLIGSEIVTNNGTVSLSGGTLNTKINGGKIALTGDVTTNADNLLGDISNDAKLTLTGGTIQKDIAESENGGSIEIGMKETQDITKVTKKEGINVNQKITIGGYGNYETAANEIYLITVKDEGKITLNQGKLEENKIDGNGSVYITGNVEFGFDNSDLEKTHTLSNIEIDKTGTFKPHSDYKGTNNTITFQDGSTIDLQNGKSQTVNLESIKSNADDTLNILADYKDTFDAKDIKIGENAKIAIKSLDLSNKQDEEKNYQFTENLKGKVQLNLENLTFSENSNDTSVYYLKDDGKIYIEDFDLQTAIGKINNENLDLTYKISNNEQGILATESTLKKGSMTILGNTNSEENNSVMSGETLIVGSGEDSATLKILNTNVDNSLVVNSKGNVEITAKDTDVNINGNIKLNTDANDTSKYKLVLNAENGKTITLGNENEENSGNIISDSDNNEVTFKGQGVNSNIVANGLFDPFIANIDNVTLTKNNYDDEIFYNINNGGILKYSNDLYLFDSSKHEGTTYNKNSINFQGGTLNIANNSVNDIQLKSLALGTVIGETSSPVVSYINVDVDLANKKMDTLNAETVNVIDGSKLNVDMNIISDSSSATTNGIKFTDNDDLWNAISLGEAEECDVESAIYKYTVKKGGATANDGFTFKRADGYHGFNSAMFAPAAALQGIYYTQLNNYDLAFANIDQTMLKTQSQRKAEKFANKYAYDGEETQVFSPLYNQLENNGIWFKPYVSTEKADLKNGPKVDNTMYGALIGGDSDIITVKDWDLQYSAYVGYNGSKQSFSSNDITQNGGVLGVTASAYKGNLFSALTANASMHSTDISTKLGDSDIFTVGAGVASKTGYNFEFKNGKFIIQPSLLMSYTFVNPFSDMTVQGVKVKTESLNAFQLAPGLKFIGNTENGWQPYVGMKMVFNIDDETKLKANGVSIPETKTDPYIEYGLGVQKSAGERFTGFGQAMFRGGGRNGASFSFGGRWAVGSLSNNKTAKN